MPGFRLVKNKDEVARTSNAENYLPEGQRPKCLRCEKELCLNLIHPTKPPTEGGFAGADYTRATKVTYGYEGNGIFCTKTCGYRYGLALAKQVLFRKKELHGSSGNPLIDSGTIRSPRET